MILVDAGPLAALFDPRDSQHTHCLAALKSLTQPLRTTVPVLTEVFYLLQPQSAGADKLREFIVNDDLSIMFLDQAGLSRCFELMESCADHPMDFADASLIAAAEALEIEQIFTLRSEEHTSELQSRPH